MKTNSTLNTLRFQRIFSTLAVIIFLASTHSIAQKWSGFHGNEWLAGKYSQPWVRIGVTAKGIHKINVSDLPQAFKDADKNRLELWHRGTQVSIIKADANEIVFYVCLTTELRMPCFTDYLHRERIRITASIRMKVLTF